MGERNTRMNDSLTGRGHSRSRGASRGRASESVNTYTGHSAGGRSASQAGRSGAGAGSTYASHSSAGQRNTGRTKDSMRRSSGSGRNSGGYPGEPEDSHNGLIIGVIIVLAAIAVVVFILMKMGMIGGGKEESTSGTAAETTAETTAFDENVISTDLYLDYSALKKDAEPMNLKGMNREKVTDALKKAYSWKLTVVNKNPSLDAFTMPELPDEKESQASSDASADNAGTEEVVEVDNPLKDVTIRPEKGSFAVPDLIGSNIDCFVKQIFDDYKTNGSKKISQSAAVTDSAAETDTAAAESTSQESSSAAPVTASDKKADYVIALPDMTDSISSYVKQLALVWKMEPDNGDITSYDAKSGEFVFGGSSDGYAINTDATAKKLMDAISKQDYTASVDSEGEVISASTQSMKDKYTTIGTFTTNTTANAVRNKNVKLAAAAVNGTVVKPGQEFSFNDVVGQRTEDKGYGGAPAYNNGEVVEEVGGGVCQVSSTLYNAVFRSGLTTTYRRSHTFAPSYVTPGTDATVSWPGPDYKFVNDSDHAVGIRASYSNQTCTVSIYGIRVLPDGVSWELTSEKVKDLPLAPVQIITEGKEEKGTTGSEWQAYKIITTNGKTEKVKDHYTSYKGHTPKQLAAATAAESAAETVTAAGESIDPNASAAETAASAAETAESAAPETSKAETAAPTAPGSVSETAETSENAEVIAAGPGSDS